MTNFVVDAGVVFQLASATDEVSAEHELLAPPLPRSQTSLALRSLQADAFVALDEKLARSVQGVAPTATIDALGVTR